MLKKIALLTIALVAVATLQAQVEFKTAKPAKPAAKAVIAQPVEQPNTDSKTTESQTKAKAENADSVYVTVDEMPSFPGGADSLEYYIRRHLIFPMEAIDQHITGRVIISFIIERDGTVTNGKVLRDIGAGCGDEAVRMASELVWNPGKVNGQPVRTMYTMPIEFKW